MKEKVIVFFIMFITISLILPICFGLLLILLYPAFWLIDSGYNLLTFFYLVFLLSIWIFFDVEKTSKKLKLTEKELRRLDEIADSIK